MGAKLSSIREHFELIEHFLVYICWSFVLCSLKSKHDNIDYAFRSTIRNSITVIKVTDVSKFIKIILNKLT